MTMGETNGGGAIGGTKKRIVGHNFPSRPKLISGQIVKPEGREGDLLRIKSYFSLVASPIRLQDFVKSFPE